MKAQEELLRQQKVQAEKERKIQAEEKKRLGSVVFVCSVIQHDHVCSEKAEEEMMERMRKQHMAEQEKQQAEMDRQKMREQERRKREAVSVCVCLPECLHPQNTIQNIEYFMCQKLE
jgi:hypothetical protein